MDTVTISSKIISQLIFTDIGDGKMLKIILKDQEIGNSTTIQQILTV
jgi:hypothetical protein